MDTTVGRDKVIGVGGGRWTGRDGRGWERIVGEASCCGRTVDGER